MNIIILGQGAIGLLWYRALQQLGNDKVNVKIFPSSAAPAASQTFTFTEFSGLSEQRPLITADKTALSECDHLLVCVKSYQVKQALKPVLPHLNTGSSIILSHNGMGTLAELPEQVIDKHAILTLLTTHGCLRVKPRHIRHTGRGFSDIGLVSGQLAVKQQTELTNLLNLALPQVEWTNNIVEKQWRKLAVNSVINPLTALHQLKNGQILKDKFTAQITAILTEVSQVAKSQGIELNLRELEQVVTGVAQATSNNISSMRCDVLGGKKTEIDYISGYIHRLGEEQHIATPENTRLWQQVSAL
ncbi:2-dehydropantoate 2-reductase [Thalassomonas actiniarum]|uniref:2-dehydropantoate 2-reductase n=1 Tax=Thalassomonas actiniarum TaxID=485447 RepID=A0AAE9YS97_9GAMM|nr:2-dehydropantoate 2-reductase [Thalassomonas actiniarum]WDE00141.1 2-dehydropantoate 2-reductase [Thalassomonas actiniarum]